MSPTDAIRPTRHADHPGTMPEVTAAHADDSGALPVVKDGLGYLTQGHGLDGLGRVADATPTDRATAAGYCTKCGAALPGTARFCSGCGHAVS